MAKRQDITKEVVQRHCRRVPGTEIKKLWSGGWTVSTVSGGYADIKPRKIKNISGGSDIYEIVGCICKEAWGSMVVEGTPAHIMTSMAYGEALDVPVIPEVRGCGCLTAFLNLLLIPIAYYAFVFLLGISTSILPPALAVIAALVMTICVTRGVRRSIMDSMTRKARQKAQGYRNPFPNVLGSNRDATREEIEKRGLL